LNPRGGKKGTRKHLFEEIMTLIWGKNIAFTYSAISKWCNRKKTSPKYKRNCCKPKDKDVILKSQNKNT
jgi:hypothetical protein